MEDNMVDGFRCYERGDQKTRDWFHRQWSIWPTRSDERFTTNISFHYGAIKAFRLLNGTEPTISPDFTSHVRYFDRSRTVQELLSVFLSPEPTPSDHSAGEGVGVEIGDHQGGGR